MRKNIFAVAIFAFIFMISAAAKADQTYYGDCNVLIQTIRGTAYSRDHGIPSDQAMLSVGKSMEKTAIGNAATDKDRMAWNSLVRRIYSGENISNKEIATSVGRFCQPPYSVVQYSYKQIANPSKPNGKAKSLISQYENLNDVCRGGSGNDNSTWDACHKRDALSKKIADQGWCYEGDTPDAYEYQKTWRRCAQENQNKSTSDRDRKSRACLFKGDLFSWIAVIRNSGRSPQEAYNSSTRYLKEDIDESFLKNAINLVYFDPGFSYAGGDALKRQIMDLCMRDWKPKYQPLR